LLSRRHLAAAAVCLMFSLAALCGLSSGRAQSGEKEEREVVDKIPKHLPIKVKIKKPEKLKDARDENWLDDLSIEVTNTGTKPIFFLSIHLAMPDVLAPDGHKYAFLYKYGRIDLAAFEESVRPDDVPLQPGETVTLMPPANHVEGWKSLRGEGKVTNPRKLELKFQEINHGDGTGYLGTDGTPMPIRKQRSSNEPHSGGDKSLVQTTPPGLPLSTFPDYINTRPRGNLTAEPEPVRDICCQTSRPECIWMKPGG
jgi:hypothetical protein